MSPIITEPSFALFFLELSFTTHTSECHYAISLELLCVICRRFFSYAVEARKMEPRYLKNKRACSLKQQKCCLVICDHVFGREDKYFCVANGCSPMPQKLP